MWSSVLLVVLINLAILFTRVSADACTESFRGNLTTYIAASGKWINDPGDYEACRAFFPASTFCVLEVMLNASEMPGPPILPAAGLTLCAPQACATDIESGFLHGIVPLLESFHFPVEVNFSAAACGRFDELPKLPSGARAMVVILSLLGFFTVVGSFLGLFERRMSLLNETPYEDDEEELRNTPADEEALLGGKRKKKPYVVAGPIANFFRCFSVFHNLPRLVSHDHSNLAFLNGMRVMSMCWVITGHTLLWVEGLLDNLVEIGDIVGRLYMQLIWNAPFSVDTFFFMSGLLVAYLTQAAMAKGRFSWPLYYIHRYMRLTPVYLFWIFIYWKLLPYIATGPFWSHRIRAALGDCSVGWWRNILYINNLFPFQNACHPVAWYLGNDMQFYVVVPLLLYPFSRFRRLRFLGTGAIVCVLLLASIIATWLIVGLRHMTGGLRAHHSNEYQDEVYMKPWTRAGAYLVGVGTGIFLGAYPKLRIWAFVRYPLYIIAATAALALLLSPHRNYVLADEPWSNQMWYSYFALSRTTWALCLALFTVPFAYGYGDFVRRFMGARFWTPLARLTYGAYLIHPLWLSYWTSLMTTQLRYNFRNYLMWAIYAIVISYGLAFVSYLILEKPLMNLEAWATRELLGRGRDTEEAGTNRRGINDARE